MAAIADEPLAVSTSQIEELHANGFLVLRQLTTPEDLARLAQLVARLYRRYNHLALRGRAHDLGGAADEQPRILEINQALDLDPTLATTQTFRRCWRLAQHLLGRSVEHRFDHTIYKPAFNGAATAWHQDEAYTLDRNLVTLHFWVPLHDVSVEMGCMQFIPGSHRQPMRRHHRRDGRGHALETNDIDVSRAVACPLRAGDATVHFARTLHYTGPNLTGMPRTAWSLEFGPRLRLPLRLYSKVKLYWRQTRRFARL
jgi:hypothetical protein